MHDSKDDKQHHCEDHQDSRSTQFQALAEQSFDVVIIGGGINGAVSCAALAAAGARVALFEQGDFASSTSQESSNLVWGGIKYLEAGELGLVHKLCKSRNHLNESYPSNVSEIRFFTNLGQGFRWPRIMIFCATILYWIIGRFYTKPPRLLSKQIIARQEPVINTEQSKGGVEYSDYYLRDNDARFVFSFIRKSWQAGATCLNYAEAKSCKFDVHSRRWQIEVTDRTSKQTIRVTSRVLINATGPFADGFNATLGVRLRHRHVLSKGVHLIVRQLPAQQKVLTFFADDGRMFFVIPMGHRSCIGTTDTKVSHPHTEASDEDRRFILDNINRRLNLDPPLTTSDIISERCGVRPLVVEIQDTQTEADWTHLSRKHAIESSQDQQLISIFGGKLTDCLNIGDEVAHEVRRLGVDLKNHGTKWYGEGSSSQRRRFFAAANRWGLDAKFPQIDSSDTLSQRLWRRYQEGAFKLLDAIKEDPALGQPMIQGVDFTVVEAQHAARHEMIVELEDLLRRRTPIGLLHGKNFLRKAQGLHELCRILFAQAADKKLSQYFESPHGTT